MTQGCRRAGEQFPEGLVEAAHAIEARSQRHLGHRQRRLVDQLLGKQDTPRLRHRDRRGPEMPLKQPPQLPPTDAEPVGKTLDIVAIEAAGFNQGKRARHGIGRAAPERELRRDFRPAAQARPEARFLRRRRGRKERHVLEFRSPRRADRPAIDSGGFDAHEQPPVEADVAGRDRAVAGDAVHIDPRTIDHCAFLSWWRRLQL